MSGILADATDDPAPETETEEAAGVDGQDRGDGSSVLATDEPSPGPARDDQADADPEEPETEETEPDGRTEDAFDREMAVARARIVANAMRIILNG